MVVHSNIRLWRARVWMRLYYKAYQNRCIKLFFWVLLLFYPMLCQRVIGSFYCDEVGDHYYLSLDRSNLCYVGTWLYYLPVSITLIVFWVIGVPLLFWVIIAMKRSRGVSDMLLLISDPSQESLKQQLLMKMRLDITDHGEVANEEQIKLFETEMLAHFLRDRNLNEPSTVAQVGFIYHSYETHFWWFEVWDLGRKLLLNSVISLLAKAGANRIICGLVVMLVYLSMMLFYQPYRERSDSALAGVTNIQLFITLFCGLILKMGALYLDTRVVRLVTSAAIVSNIMTLIYAVFSILNEKCTAWKMARRSSREILRRAIATHVRKLWREAYGYALTEVYLSKPEPGPMSLLVMKELARREKYQQEMDDLNAQLELTSAMLPPLSPDEQGEAILAASQVDVFEDEATAPNENAEGTTRGPTKAAVFDDDTNSN
ncbi:outer membrane protein PmpB [Phytophthora cinnamomi]|uniref:outer membrane protein PmpB n=1 Tax=Phytophthora cinnamomi TaxID=4785 RepID=UPI003559C37D|nr:outer membrane protein PmpB [Phytophthora cinnamomi]